MARNGDVAASKNAMGRIVAHKNRATVSAISKNGIRISKAEDCFHSFLIMAVQFRQFSGGGMPSYLSGR
jgi:hypothetical protein